jgi:hypothetical protein
MVTGSGAETARNDYSKATQPTAGDGAGAFYGKGKLGTDGRARLGLGAGFPVVEDRATRDEGGPAHRRQHRQAARLAAQAVVGR